MTARTAPPVRPPRLAAAWLLALALVAAQLLGMVHRVEHGPLRGAAASAERHAHDRAAGARDAHAVDAATLRTVADAPAALDAPTVRTVAFASHALDVATPGVSDADAPRSAVHDCAAFDHATVADAAPWPAATTSCGAPPLPAVAARADTPRLAAQAAGYLARGPPAA